MEGWSRTARRPLPFSSAALSWGCPWPLQVVLGGRDRRVSELRVHVGRVGSDRRRHVQQHPLRVRFPTQGQNASRHLTASSLAPDLMRRASWRPWSVQILRAVQGARRRKSRASLSPAPSLRIASAKREILATHNSQSCAPRPRLGRPGTLPALGQRCQEGGRVAVVGGSQGQARGEHVCRN